MRIAIVGYGKMGHEIEQQARRSGIEVASIIDPADPNATHKAIDDSSLTGADVAVDFSVPDATLNNIEAVASRGKSIVVGTTGWYAKEKEARDIMARSNAGLIYSPNFSIGVNLFFKMVENAAQLFDKFDMYDPFVWEGHHRQKADAPSGTAKALGDILIHNIKRKKRVSFGKLEGKIAEDELQISSTRAGCIPGTHTVGFDSEADTIELTHTARSRAGFASGALLAAKWIQGKKGFYTINDMLAQL